jgi:large subunit ribosomal protein L32
MGVPKRQTSKARIRSRKSALARKTQIFHAIPCPQCGQPRLPHRACPSCGYYRGRQVLIIKSKEEKKAEG